MHDLSESLSQFRLNERDDLDRFSKAFALLIFWLEQQAALPPKLSGQGRNTWELFKSNLRYSDLFELAVRDAAGEYPLAFKSLDTSYAGFPFAALRQNDSTQLKALFESLDEVNLLEIEPAGLYRLIAELLSFPLPDDSSALARLDGLSPERNWLVYELPGSGGFLSLLICHRFEKLDFVDNIEVACRDKKEMTLAASAAILLGVPPRKELRVYEDSQLARLTKGDKRFHLILGNKERFSDPRLLQHYLLSPDEGRIILA
jgi:hypothetical protein